MAILNAVPFDVRVPEDVFLLSLADSNSFDRYIKLKFGSRLNSSVAQAFQDFHYFLFEAKEDEFQKLKSRLLPNDCVKSIGKILKKDQMILANFDQMFVFFSETLDTFSHLSNGVLLVQFSFFFSDSLEILNAYLKSQLEM